MQLLKDDESIISPRGDTIINAGDIVVMFVPVKSMKKVEELLSVNLDFFNGKYILCKWLILQYSRS